VIPAGLAVLLLLATLGEGGGTPTATLVVHGALALLLVAATLAGRGGEVRGIVARGPALAFAVFAALAVVGAARASYAFAAWLVLLEIAAFAATLWLASRSASALETLLPTVLAIGAGMHGAAAIFESLTGGGRPDTTFLNTNHLGAWLVASALVVADRALRAFGVRRAVGGIAVLLAVGGVVATGSRGALVALGAGTVVLVARRWKESTRQARIAIALTGALVLLAAGSVVAARLADADPYHWERIRIWRASIQAAVDDPWLGTGPGQFAAAAPNLNFAQEDDFLRFGRSFRSPHSDLVRLPAEFGWPAALAALGVAALAVVEIRRTGGGAGAIAALAALGAQALFDDLTTRPAIVLLAAVLAGILLSRPGEPTPSRGIALRVAGASAVLLLLAVGEISPWLAWRETRGLPRGPLDGEGLARLERSLARNPMHPDGWTRLAEHEVGDGSDWNLDRYARAREAAERAIRLQPSDATFRRAAAWVEGMACRTLTRDLATRERAAARYREAALLSRNDATIPLEEARFLLSTGDPEGARRAAERALRIEPRAAAPRAVLAEALLATEGDRARERALELLAEAVDSSLVSVRGVSPYEARLRSIEPERVAALRTRAGGAVK
jgi:tetratricopeptide (TPR) repeat protein